MFEVDNLGFLKSADAWTLEWAKEKADEYALAWESIDEKIIISLREFYYDFDLSPAMRPLVKHLKNQLGPEIGNSIFLMQRYGESPARMLALLAGLPKPKNCL